MITIQETKPKHRHAEAYFLMTYICEGCKKPEIIWNSRDGVTPFIIHCRLCGNESVHVGLRQGIYYPEYKLSPGERYFRNGTDDEARNIIKQRIKSARDRGAEISQEQEAKMLDLENRGPLDGFSPGWPLLDVAE